MEASEFPRTVELCKEIKAGHELMRSPCLGVVKELDNQGFYCYSCGSRKPGVRYTLGEWIAVKEEAE